jgi:hypothetical protein
MSTIGGPPTRDLGPIPLPPKCLTAASLRALATVLDRVASFHKELGGQAPDAPCLTAVAVQNGRILASITSGKIVYDFEWIREAWEMVHQ